jgi:hypothetical protein
MNLSSFVLRYRSTNVSTPARASISQGERDEGRSERKKH